MGNLYGVVANMLNCDTVEREFKLQSHNHNHFWTNTLEKGMKPLISLTMGETVSLLFFYKDGFGIK